MEIALDILSWIFLVLGSFFAVVGGFGIVRMPEFFSRLHGGGVTDTAGAGFLIIGLALQAPNGFVAAKLAIILFFLLLTSPASCHALAKSALLQGLEPILEHDERIEAAKAAAAAKAKS